MVSETAVNVSELPGSASVIEKSSTIKENHLEVVSENKECKKEKENSTDDILSDMVYGLSHLGYTADGTTQTFLHLNLVNLKLESLDFVSSYKHIQVLDVSHNNLQEIYGLKDLPCLISLNISHNQLTRDLHECLPSAIREVNVSNNQMNSIGDLSSYKLLHTLLMDHNFVEEINGVDQCFDLKNLSLSNNSIHKISGLKNLPIKEIDLSHNNIKKIENLQSLKYLQYINLSSNSIRSLRGLQDHDLLEDINLENNQILDLSEIRYIRDLRLLRLLNLNGNSIQGIPDYRLAVLFRLPALMELDLTVVQPEDKVAAVNLFNPHQELCSGVDHMFNLMASYQQSVSLLHSSLPSSDSYPMLIITGTIGLGKKLLAKKLCRDFPNYFKVAIGHATRCINSNTVLGESKPEEDGIDYQFCSKEEFEVKREQGDFIQTCTINGQYYGISRQAIEATAIEGLACVFTMELEGVMSFKRTHFQPRCVLLLPESKKNYEELLVSSGRYTESQVAESVKKISIYTEYNQDRPGYFDACIVTDSFEERYIQLKSIVLDYLGLTPPNSARNSHSISNKQSRIKLESGSGRESPYGLKHSLATSLLKATDGNEASHRLSPAAIASYERRYEMTKAAVQGVELSNEKIIKARTPLSAATVPLVRGYDNLIYPHGGAPHTTPAKVTTTETLLVKPTSSSESQAQLSTSIGSLNSEFLDQESLSFDSTVSRDETSSDCSM